MYAVHSHQYLHGPFAQGPRPEPVSTATSVESSSLTPIVEDKIVSNWPWRLPRQMGYFACVSLSLFLIPPALPLISVDRAQL